MKRCFIVIAIFLLLSPAVPLKASAETLPYTDVPENSSHYEGIRWVTEKGITGYPDGRYGLNEHLSREHAARFFTLVLDTPLLQDREVERYFTDVNRDHLYAAEIATVAKEGIFSGNNRKFMPDNNLTRQQMATTLVNVYDLDSRGADVPANLDDVAESHKENVQTIMDLSITTETENFRPNDPVTRAEFATFLHRSFLHAQNETEVLPDLEIEIPEEPDIDLPPAAEREYTYETKNYNMDFSTVVNKQMNANPAPKTDSAWKWYDAGEELTAYYLNPNNFTEETAAYYQFLKLDQPAGLSPEELDELILKGKGILEGTGKYFVEASEKYGINEFYLISHALLETGNGTSQLATGVTVRGETVYNMYGIRAFDSCALTCGSNHAYEEGWFTPGEAIIGGAKFVKEDYIGQGKDTIYKMRWNPDGLLSEGYANGQYATDVGWAVKQTTNIYEFHQLFNQYSLIFEVPVYKNLPARTERPRGEAEFAIDTTNAGAIYQTTAISLNMRSAPSTAYSIIAKLPEGTEVEVIGENTGWFKVKANGSEGWVSSDYLEEVEEKEESK